MDRALSRRAYLAGAGAAVAAVAGCSDARAAEIEGSWPVDGHDAARSFRNGDATAPGEAPSVAWSQSFGDRDASSVLRSLRVGHGRVTAALLSESGSRGAPAAELVALSAGGAVAWREADVEAVETASLTANGLLVCFESAERGVAAYDVETGDAEWRFADDAGIVTHPRVRDDAVYAATGDGAWVAVDAATGEARRRFAVDGVDGPFYRWFAIGGQRIVANAGPDAAELVGFDAETGERAWRAAPEHDVLNGPTLAGDAVLVRLGEHDRNGLLALDRADGTERWTRRFDGRIAARVVTDGDVAVVALDPADGSRGRLVGIDVDDGSERWRTDAGFAPVGSPIGLGGHAVGHDGEGSLFAVALDDGAVAWRRDLDGYDALGPLVGAGSTVYLAARDGTDAALLALA